MDYGRLCEQVLELTRKTAQFVAEQRRNFSQDDVKIKSANDLVSYVDVETEKRLKLGLCELFPDAGFIGEETAPDAGNHSAHWIVDPIDGTTNFVHNLGFYCISIGLEVDGEMKLGVVYDIRDEEAFYAWEGSAAYLNGNEIRVSEVKELKNSLLATGFPVTNFERLPEFLQTIEYLMKNTHGLRRLGSAALDLVYVGLGRFDGFYEYNLKPWDVAAGAFIVQQAGGKVADFSGGSNWLHGREIVAANPNIFPELVAVTNRYFIK